MSSDRDFRTLIRWCVAFITVPVLVVAVNAAARTEWAAVIVGVVGSATILAAYRVGARACDELDAYEAVHPLPSYEPLGLAEEWGYTTGDGAA